jgi:type VI secretion system protein ImpJ
MVLDRKVMWIEGMFLRPHHFQQQDRRTETMLASRVAALQPFYWGFSRLEIDEGALNTGKIAIAVCEGAFPDGLPFSFPGDSALIEPLELEGGQTDVTIYLAAPVIAAGSQLGAEAGADGNVRAARYAIETHEVPDALSVTTPPEVLKLGEPTLRLVAGERPREGFESLPLARVVEVTTDRRVVLDPDFIPPILSVDVARGLARSLSEIAGVFEARAEYLAGPYSEAGAQSVSAQEQFMLLQICNRWTARLKQICDLRAQGREGRPLIHPVDLHRDLVEAAAELAAFTEERTRRPPAFPPYDHDRLTEVYMPVLEELRRSLGHMGVQKAVPIPLKFHPREKVFYNPTMDSALLDGGTRFILVARAKMLEDQFRGDLPRRVSIGAGQEIRNIIGAAERSVPLRALSSFPAEIRPLAGWTPFELDRNAEAWSGISHHKSIAIHPQDVYEELEMTLWAIRD